MPKKYIAGLTDENCTDPRGLATRLGYRIYPLSEADSLCSDDPVLVEHLSTLRSDGFTHLAVSPEGRTIPAIL